MSTSYYFDFPTGKTLYFVLTDPGTGNVWNGGAFEAPNLSNWTNYAQSMTETAGMGRYQLPFPTGITTRGRYSISIRKKIGAAVAVTDTAVGGGDLGWTGTDITSIESMPIYSGFDLTRVLQKIMSSATGPVSGAGSGHVVFNDPSNTIAEFECNVDQYGNRSGLNYHS